LSLLAVYNMGGKHWRKRDIDEAVRTLVEEYGVMETQEPTGGRPKRYLNRVAYQ